MTIFPESGGHYDAQRHPDERTAAGIRLDPVPDELRGQDSLHPGRLISILRASHNPLEQMQMVSYIIAVGLLWHFCPGLREVPAPVEQKQEKEPVPEQSRGNADGAGKGKRWRLVGICVLVAGIFAVGMLAARPSVHTVRVERYTPWSSSLVEKVEGMAVQDGGASSQPPRMPGSICSGRWAGEASP